MKYGLIAAILVAAALNSLAQSSTQTSGDEAAVRQLIASFVEAFNARNAARVTQLRTPDMDRRSNQNGRIILLNDAQQGTPVMNNPANDQRWTREVDKIRFITPEVALVDTHGDEYSAKNPTGTVQHVFNTYVAVKGSDGTWRIAASRF